jgi:hypothetical protein
MPPLLSTDGRRIAEISVLRALQNQRQRNPDFASSGLEAIGAIPSFLEGRIWLKDQIVFVIVHSIKQAAEKRPFAALPLRAGPSSLRRTAKYASLLRILGALHPGIFEQPAIHGFFSKLLEFQQLRKIRIIR